jgi:hypothetical protein
MPITWASRLQTELAMSSTESEYIALFTALREPLPMVELIQELVDAGFKSIVDSPTISCTTFKDDKRAMEMAKLPKFRPRIKHIKIKYHHFYNSIRSVKISMKEVSTTQQQADIFTKPLALNLFQYWRKLFMGW